MAAEPNPSILARIRRNRLMMACGGVLAAAGAVFAFWTFDTPQGNAVARNEKPPAEPSDGRAVNANQVPSAEKAADSPTILTFEAIASDAAIVGSGVTLGVAEGSTEAVGVEVGVSSGLAAGVSLGGGAVAAAVSVGVALGSTVGVAVESGLALEKANTWAMPSQETNLGLSVSVSRSHAPAK